MKVKALISFGGLISMGIGEVRDIENEDIVKDLLKADYVKRVGKADKIEEINNEEVRTNED